MKYKQLLGLSGKVWPVHIKPLPDEVLSSWIIRLAHANGLKVMTMSTLAFGYHTPIWNRDIDKLAPKKVLQRLSEITATPLDIVKSCTLKSYESYLVEKINSYGNTRWILPVGIYHRKRTEFGLQYCPLCLQEDKKPYFRKLWRLSLITCCTKHGIVLNDRCPHCSSPISPFRSDINNRTVYPNSRLLITCGACNKTITQKNDIRIADDILIHNQKAWENAVFDGWIRFSENNYIYSHLYFDGLSSLLESLLNKKISQKLYHYLDRSKNIERGDLSKRFDTRSALERHAILSDALRFISNWPEIMVKRCVKSKVTYSMLMGGESLLPYWYQFPLRMHLLNKSSEISEKEVISIQATTKYTFGNFTLKNARNLSGRDLSKKSLLNEVSVDTYEKFIVSIDHEIAGTLDINKRHELIRDKIMFVVAFILNLNISDIVKIDKKYIESLNISQDKPNFYNVPIKKNEAFKWLRWYYDIYMLKEYKIVPMNGVFISIYTGRALKKSSISARYQRAVKAAGLEDKLHNFTTWKSKHLIGANDNHLKDDYL